MSETRFCLECDRKTVSGDSYGRAYCRECGSFYDDSEMNDREKKIADIKSDVLIPWEDRKTIILLRSDRAVEILRFTTDGEIFLYGRKLETDKEIVEAFKIACDAMGITRLKAENKRLREERDKLIEALRWYADEENQKLDESTRHWENVYSPYEMDGGQRARDILKEIGVMMNE